MKLSFLDDNHAGGTIKHMAMYEANGGGADATIVGYNGMDELVKLSTLKGNSDLNLHTFLEKYSMPFTATAVLPKGVWTQELAVPICCYITFNKDLHKLPAGVHPPRMATVWTYEPVHGVINITFDDPIDRAGSNKPMYNTWQSTDFIRYELAKTLNKAAFSDRCCPRQALVHMPSLHFYRPPLVWGQSINVILANLKSVN